MVIYKNIIFQMLSVVGTWSILKAANVKDSTSIEVSNVQRTLKSYDKQIIKLDICIGWLMALFSLRVDNVSG